MNKKKRKRQKKQVLIPVPVILAAVILLCFSGITSARYVMQKENSTVAEAEGFYFTSDFLKEESENASYFIDPETEGFAIRLFNYADSQRTTVGKITYQITVEGGTAEAQPDGNSLGGPGQAEAPIKIVPGPAGAAQEVRTITVTAVSTSPYSKTLKADFILKSGNRFSIEDQSGNKAAALTMICADAAKKITINLPEGVIPDAADDRVTAYDSSTNTCSFSSGGYGIYSLVLLKKDASKELSVVENGAFADSIKIQLK